MRRSDDGGGEAIITIITRVDVAVGYSPRLGCPFGILLYWALVVVRAAGHRRPGVQGCRCMSKNRLKDMRWSCTPRVVHHTDTAHASTSHDRTGGQNMLIFSCDGGRVVIPAVTRSEKKYHL